MARWRSLSGWRCARSRRCSPVRRRVPLALAKARYPEVADMLEGELAEAEIISLQGKFVFRPFGASGVSIPRLSAREHEVLAQVTDRPKPMRKVAVSSGAQRALRS